MSEKKNESGTATMEASPDIDRVSELESKLDSVISENQRQREHIKRLQERQEILDKRDDTREISTADVVVGQSDIESYLNSPEPDDSVYFISYTEKGVDSPEKETMIPLIPDTEEAKTAFLTEKRRSACLQFEKPNHFMLRDGPYCIKQAKFTSIMECTITELDLKRSEEAWKGNIKDFPRLSRGLRVRNGVYSVEEIWNHLKLRMAEPDIRNKRTTFMINPWDPTSVRSIPKFMMGVDFQTLVRAYYEERLRRNQIPQSTHIKISSIQAPKPIELSSEQRRALARENAVRS